MGDTTWLTLAAPFVTDALLIAGGAILLSRYRLRPHWPWVVLAYVLCVLSTLLCVIYGIANWNKGDEPVKEEDVAWAEEEKEEVEEAL